jgi:hypothetical protein
MKKELISVYLVYSLALSLIAWQLERPALAVKGNRSCFPPPKGLTNWWPGDGNPQDIVGRQNAELFDQTTTGAGLIDRAFILDGEGDFVNISHHPKLNLGTDDFTLNFWVYFNHANGEQVLVEKWIQRFPGSLGWTLTKLENNVLRLALANGDGTDTNVDSAVLPIPSRTWTHFAATRKRGYTTLYMNAMPVALGQARLNIDSDASIKFGHRGNPSDTPGSEDNSGFFLNGRIDEVQLFVGRSLPYGLIQSIFRARNAGQCKETLRLD